MAVVQEQLPAGLRTVDEALHRARFRILPFLGPDSCVRRVRRSGQLRGRTVAAGSKFGYLLVWVVVGSELLAMVIQTLSAQLGIATGRNLPEVCREQFSRRHLRAALAAAAEAIAMATDLAGVHSERRSKTSACCSGSSLPSRDESRRRSPRSRCSPLRAPSASGRSRPRSRRTRRPDRAPATSIEMLLRAPGSRRRRRTASMPQLRRTRESVLLAVGILGATVMPHVIYLHSALTQDRIVPGLRREESACR